ncbi:dTDP-4-dehydrorhamnose reductase [Alkalilimnicola sp. S0819]|uniref:dTDP-4-dehydrorhamnose reductase n=1 Tax=Alkalilimnicola sp. S0819 TaxID=2613922 RepID=UPI0012623270|nr:dTDP-4-dehydrorhamnose reductase [Alkalilimnicola sp. S0819]KAB7627327.1 dTDP-4-dehydrorhamnose reductase [Alkalilimnicola sp. S0819]MPQ16043.1 dTDP-4-dehydrorhamnose reductase [Alkalilimnicola sp. S0819]
MKVLVTGGAGQLGRELARSRPEGVELLSPERKALDIVDGAAVDDFLRTHAPAVIINAAAYTAVDRAEQEAALAEAVNAEGAANLARAARAQGARLVQVSTDFVFDGAQGRPYRPEDAVGPLSVYGQSKLRGEQAVREQLGDEALILRTAWVYAAQGKNFVHSMLRLMAERDELAVVVDQLGTPTWARGLAAAIWRALALGIRGTQHWTDAGVASWYDFAVAIQEEALALGLLERPVTIRPIRSEQFPTPARRPAGAVLDKSAFWEALGEVPPHWRVALRAMLKELAHG